MKKRDYSLYHGTTEKSAKSILEKGFEIRDKQIDSWCGYGIYFYDIVEKAWYSADKKCHETKGRTTRKNKSAVLCVEISVDKERIFDLRDMKEMKLFQKTIEAIIPYVDMRMNSIDEFSQRVALRASYIEFYADKERKGLIIGHFMQRCSEKEKDIIMFADKMNLMVCIDTIYCLRDLDCINSINYIGG